MESHGIKNSEVPYNRFTMTPNRWKKDFNAIGIIPSSGRYSKGTYAHPDIAFEFASWLSPEFKLYLITEFQRLKVNEQKELEWSAKRELAKVNYRIHTDAIKENIVPTLTEKQKLYVYANEADILNVALFGITAKQWRDENPDSTGNIRDYATINQLICLSNMENLNAVFINKGMPQSERLKELNRIAIQQMSVLEKIENRKVLK